MNIKINELSKIYGKGSSKIVAIDCVNLSIEQGDLIAIKGVSGSGKTTLLNMLGLLEKPSIGTIYYDGESVNDLSERKRALLRNKCIGFVLQEFGLLEDQSVYNNISIPMRIAGINERKRRSRCEEVLRNLDISYLLNKTVNSLSGGQKQRVAIARAIVMNPEIILADEPTGALDYETKQVVMKELLALNRQGKTIIIVTHDEQVANQCQRVISIIDGKLVYE